jgi:hypothetical protein
MFFNGTYEDLDTRNFHPVQFRRQRRTFLAGNAAGPPIADIPLGVERAIVATNGDVFRAEFKADAGGLQCPASDDIFKRIVSE